MNPIRLISGRKFQHVEIKRGDVPSILVQLMWNAWDQYAAVRRGRWSAIHFRRGSTGPWTTDGCTTRAGTLNCFTDPTLDVRQSLNFVVVPEKPFLLDTVCSTLIASGSAPFIIINDSLPVITHSRIIVIITPIRLRRFCVPIQCVRTGAKNCTLKKGTPEWWSNSLGILLRHCQTLQLKLRLGTETSDIPWPSTHWYHRH